MLNKIGDLFLKNRIESFLFVLLFLTVSTISVVLIDIQSKLGIYYWDIFVYLGNALRYAGLGVGDQMLLPPLLPILTSIFFRLGYVSQNVVFVLGGIFYVLGVIGLYLLLKERFDAVSSFAGSIFFACLSLMIPWAVSGATDTPALTLCIWAVLFTVRARKNPRCYYFAFPLAALAFFTRYTSGFIIILILFYIIINKEYLKNLKNILRGIGISIIVSIPFTVLFYRISGNPLPFLGQMTNTATRAVTTANPGYNLDLLYYLKYIPNYISNIPSDSYSQILTISGPATIISYLILSIIIVGILIYLYNIISSLKESESRFSQIEYLKLLSVIILGIILVFSYSHISYLISEIIFFMIAFLLFDLIRGQEGADLDILFLAWFMMYFLFLSYHAVKVDRYILTAMPALAYFLTLSLSNISSKIKFKYNKTNLSTTIMSAAVVVMMLSSAIYYTGEMPHDYYWIDNEVAAADFLMDYDPQYQSKVIVADRGPAFSWYLKKRVYTRIPRNFKNSEDFYRELDTLKADYYIDVLKNPKIDIPGYEEIKTIGIITIYKRI
ncbi:MAG: glycosyltransferase family 39 protein [Methanobacteriaceae archaeon]|nr:glycosyltransferase family 39 protein [Methanobacteriaceae archaeon]